jgi:hypothetical protein
MIILNIWKTKTIFHPKNIKQLEDLEGFDQTDHQTGKIISLNWINHILTKRINHIITMVIIWYPTWKKNWKFDHQTDQTVGFDISKHVAPSSWRFHGSFHCLSRLPKGISNYIKYIDM